MWATGYDTSTIGDPLLRAVVERYGWLAADSVVFVGARMLVDRQIVAAFTGRSEHTVRARCYPLLRDTAGPGRRRVLYDLAESVELLGHVATRAVRQVIADADPGRISFSPREACPQEGAAA